MSASSLRPSRRTFLTTAGAALLAPEAVWAQGEKPPGGPAAPRPRIAAINSVYRMRSHAFHIAGRFIDGYTREGFHHQPPFHLVRMYNDQTPPNDLGRSVAKKHNIELCDNVAATLGGDKMDVDGVLLIIEHGDYPLNEFGQMLYPRYKLFREIAAHFERTGRVAPVFVDKHLSYDHRHAAEMVATARKLKIPLMAGSSLPVTWRRPELELPHGAKVTEALVCHAGGVEIYGLHGLETLQCLLERRAGGETGIKSVRAIQGPAVWKAGDDGLWSRELLEAALGRSPSRNTGDMRDNVENPVVILVEYRDGTRGAVLNLAEHVSDITFAARLADRKQPVSTLFELPAPPGARFFDPLVHYIERFFTTRTAPYPVERTLLTSTALDFAMRSLKTGETYTAAALGVTYAPPRESFFFRGRVTDAG